MRQTPASRPSGAFLVRPTHLSTRLAQVEKKSESRVVAVQVRGGWTGGESLLVGSRSWRVARAASVLAVREALVEFEDAGGDARLVILTPLETQELGWDVLARIARQRVFVLESWELLRDLFRAHGVDPRVARMGWLADVLLEHAPPADTRPRRVGCSTWTRPGCMRSWCSSGCRVARRMPSRCCGGARAKVQSRVGALFPTKSAGASLSDSAKRLARSASCWQLPSRRGVVINCSRWDSPAECSGQIRRWTTPPFATC
ncbi:MAG: hypothetical protein IPP20_11195 [Gemmatimonadetes bacterium]|nr:hypothetical protein [Gemmatimonadota bacterium]